MFKDKRSSLKTTLKQIEPEKDEFIVEKIARVDGHQTIKKYKKCQLLGKGGFANCFTTENPDTKKKSATKVIEKDLLTSQKTKLRLLNQIKLHKTLHHPNIVEFEHHFEDKNNVYIFLELCENMSLNEVIKVRNYFTTPEIQFFIQGMVQGLKYLHSKSVMHRDLKLGNIFLDKKFNIKLGDFGLATKLEFKREFKRTICGTPNYIAPEVLEGNSYHFEVDIWSIGVILYTLYYTIPPFETEEASTTYSLIKKCEYTIPKYFMVPEEANHLIRRILVKNPADRPTLDEILESSFMKLGNGIYKELPEICSKRAPSKKDFAGIEMENVQNILNTSKSATLSLSTKNKLTQSFSKGSFSAVPEDYITTFQALNQNQYFYITCKGECCIFDASSSETLIRTESNVFLVLKAEPRRVKQNLKIVQNHELKPLLNYKRKSHGLTECGSHHGEYENHSLNQTGSQQQTLGRPYVQIRKVSKQTLMHLVRTNNQIIHLFFEDGTVFIVTNRLHLFEVNSQKRENLIKIQNDQIRTTASHSDDSNCKSSKCTVDPTKAKYISCLIDQIAKKQQKGMPRVEIQNGGNSEMCLGLPKSSPYLKKAQIQSTPFRQINK